MLRTTESIECVGSPNYFYDFYNYYNFYYYY